MYNSSYGCGVCPVCGRTDAVKKNGTAYEMVYHRVYPKGAKDTNTGPRCEGTGQIPQVRFDAHGRQLWEDPLS